MKKDLYLTLLRLRVEILEQLLFDNEELKKKAAELYTEKVIKETRK